ncbi:hypothetical protein QNN00_12890 [Bacillus velezensis]|nr:hypothetical protein [Bacillus velezensis]
MKDAAFFDPLFFQISPRDALNMDSAGASLY